MICKIFSPSQTIAVLIFVWAGHMLDFDLKLMCCIHLLHELENMLFFFGNELHVFYYFSGGGTSPAPFQNLITTVGDGCVVCMLNF